MKCVYCKGSDFQNKSVDEEFKKGADVVIVPINALVCSSCGERYYDRKTMRHLEEIYARIEANEVKLSPIGRLLRAAV